MGKVEAKAFGTDSRASLLDVVAQRAPQCRVQQVGGGVVAHDIPPALGVDGRSHLLADREGALLYRAAM